MPILAAIVSGLLFWGLFWLVRMDGHVVIGEKLRLHSYEKRRARIQQRQHEDELRQPLRMIQDPREAAVMLMLFIAKLKGDYSFVQIGAIKAEMATTFGYNDKEVEDVLHHSRFVAGNTRSLDHVIEVLGPMLKERLAAPQRLQMIDMLDKIAALDGPPLPEQLDAIHRLRLGLDVLRPHSL